MASRVLLVAGVRVDFRDGVGQGTWPGDGCGRYDVGGEHRSVFECLHQKAVRPLLFPRRLPRAMPGLGVWRTKRNVASQRRIRHGIRSPMRRRFAVQLRSRACRVQTERRGMLGPVRALLGGLASPATYLITFAVCSIELPWSALCVGVETSSPFLSPRSSDHGHYDRSHL